MGWVEKRLEEYKLSKDATWLERRALEHANPVNAMAHVIAAILGIYGLWMHNWTLIIAFIVLSLLGHLYVWLKE